MKTALRLLIGLALVLFTVHSHASEKVGLILNTKTIGSEDGISTDTLSRIKNNNIDLDVVLTDNSNSVSDILYSFTKKEVKYIIIDDFKDQNNYYDSIEKARSTGTKIISLGGSLSNADINFISQSDPLLQALVSKYTGNSTVRIKEMSCNQIDLDVLEQSRNSQKGGAEKPSAVVFNFKLPKILESLNRIGTYDFDKWKSTNNGKIFGFAQAIILNSPDLAKDARALCGAYGLRALGGPSSGCNNGHKMCDNGLCQKSCVQ